MNRRGPRKYRPWDSLLPVEKIQKIRERRLYPDGTKLEVTTKEHGGKILNVYPWEQMKEGDFFEVKIKSSREAMYTHFRQSAAVHDIEIVVMDCFLEDKPALMVTKIIDGVTALKKKKGLATFDVKRKYQRISENRQKEKGPMAFIAPRIRKEKPEPEPTPISEEVGKGAGTFHDEYVEELAAKRRRALLEAAGLSEDDEDIMGVAK